MNNFKIGFWSFALLLTFACGSDNQADDSAAVPASGEKRKVETVTAKPVSYRETIFATGKLASKLEAKLSFKTGGIIKAVHVSEGQSLRKGQLMAELDLDEIRAQNQQATIGEEQARIQVENARLALQLAERDFRNAEGLYEDSVATLEQLENAEVQLDNARNQLEAAKKGLQFSEQQVEVADFNLKYSRIVAPANGTVLKKLAEPNELVGPGVPVFLFGSRNEAMVIRVNITDKDIIFVELGDRAEITFDAYPNQTFAGVVREIASMADPYTNTYEVEIEVDPDGEKLLSGFIGAVNIVTTVERQLLEIPVDALLSADEDEAEVFVVQDGKAMKTKVAIFRLEDSKLQISKGLAPGDQVVVSGVAYLENEDSVMIVQR